MQEWMENDLFFVVSKVFKILFFVCVIHNVVAAAQGQFLR